jgi:HPt (histidine-containing phosphotransfer) domain-containing protein
MPRLPAEIAERSQIAEAADAPPLAPTQSAVIDLAHLARMTLGEPALQRELLELFVLQSEILLARMQPETPKAVGTLAHTLCGSARGIGAWTVAGAAEAVERAAREGGSLVDAVARLSETVAEARKAVTELLRPGA